MGHVRLANKLQRDAKFPLQKYLVMTHDHNGERQHNVYNPDVISISSWLLLPLTALSEQGLHCT